MLTSGHVTKNGGQTVRSTVAKNPILHVDFMAACRMEPELLTGEDCGKGDFWPFFAAVTLVTHLQRPWSFFKTCVAMKFVDDDEGKVNVIICIALRREHTSKALRYDTRSQRISQFYLHTPRLSANGMNHTCLCLPSQSWYSFTDPRRMEGWIGLGWLVGYIPK